jgi:hypothetical protein
VNALNQSAGDRRGRAQPSGPDQATKVPPTEMPILRRLADSDQPALSADAARSILRFRFSASDKRRMNRLAAKNRQGKLMSEEEPVLSNDIRVGRTLGILQSKARQSLKAIRKSASGDE